MNDLEHDLRRLLGDKAAGAGAPMPDARLLRRARRRQLGTILGGVVVAAAIVVGSIVAISALGPGDGSTPAEPTELIDTNVNGITVTHPEGWYVVDPIEAGIESASDDLPRLVLFVSDTEPTPDTLACPGHGEGAADGFVLTLQQQPLALTGDAARDWPVELLPMDVGTSESSCYPGWTFMRASWTSGGRTLEARVGMGPEISETDRVAVAAAFASLRIASTQTGPEAFAIATGTAGGEDWELVAEVNEGFFQLRLESESGGAGMAFPREPGDPEELEFSVWRLGSGEDREVVVFGAAVSPVTRVEAVPIRGGSPVSAEVVDVPDQIGGNRDAFVLVYRPSPFPDRGATITGYDASDTVLATASVPPEAPVRLGGGVEIVSGDDWGLWIDDGSGLCYELMTAPAGAGPAGEMGCTDTGREEVGTADVLALPGDRAVVYGFLGTAADRVLVRLKDGSTVETDTIAPPPGFAYDIVAFAIELEGAKGAGGISVLDDAGDEIGSAVFDWAPNRGNDFGFTPAPAGPTG